MACETTVPEKTVVRTVFIISLPLKTLNFSRKSITSSYGVFINKYEPCSFRNQ